MKWFKFFSKKNKEEGEEEGEEEKKESTKINKPRIHVIVKREMAQNVLQTVATFYAVQDKDGQYNLTLVNNKSRFKEDYTFIEHGLVVHNKLRATGNSKEERTKVLEDAIKEQLQRLARVREGYLFTEEDLKKWDASTSQEEKDRINKQKINIVDEENKLKFLKITKEKIRFQGQGSYEEINERGERQITFVAEEGVFIPVFHDCDHTSAYIDTSLARKLFYEATERNEQLRKEKDGMNGWFWQAIKILIILLILVLLFGGYRLMEMNHDLVHDKDAQAKFLDESYLKEFVEQTKGDGVSCAYYYTELMKMEGSNLIEIRNRLSNITLTQLENEKDSLLNLDEAKNLQNAIP